MAGVAAETVAVAVAGIAVAAAKTGAAAAAIAAGTAATPAIAPAAEEATREALTDEPFCVLVAASGDDIRVLDVTVCAASGVVGGAVVSIFAA